MNNFPRQKLCEIIAQYGRDVCYNPQQCEGLLKDFCGQYRKEVFLLVNALKKNVANELLKSQNRIPEATILAQLTTRLQDELGISEESAYWAVDSWGLALGFISQPRVLNNAQSQQNFTPQQQQQTEKEQKQKEEYEKKLHQYKQEFSTVVQREYPLSDKSLNKLRNLHGSLGIRLEDVDKIEKPVILDKEANHWKELATNYQQKIQDLAIQIQQKQGLEKKLQNSRVGWLMTALLGSVMLISIGAFSYNKTQEIRNQAQEIEASQAQISDLKEEKDKIEGQFDRLKTTIDQEFEGQFGKVETGRKFFLRNQCDKPIKIAIKYKQPSGEWKTEGWWNISFLNNTYLLAGGEHIRLSSPLIYYYGELQENSSYGWRGEDSVYFEGKILLMKSAIVFPDGDDDYTLSLSCPNF